MMRVLAAFSMATALFLVTAGPATAASGCSCAIPKPRQQVSGATAVFSATVTDVRVDEPVLNGGSVTASLRADHVYKGTPTAEFKVITKAEGPACGYKFVEGARYLVFARSRGSELSTSLCSGNRRLPTGDQPLRLSDRTQGMRPLTPELITALGTPVRVEAASPPAPDRTGVMVIAALAGAVVLAGIAWARRRARAR
ncbi:hypothetical protein GCM10009733_063720 [Nonomuraea maheshkhaliensis]|uniref:Tissue inhibitor of metalloproteinase n=2 Tax=Nonomuraea maheshkhaliensis TaxID=419590 RepID=A0ABN2FRH2_9ACTN